jgi:phospholipase A-2-activating protein
MCCGAEAVPQWDSTNSTWQKIGDVVDAVGSGRKQLYHGKEYDYVFDVDIQDGVPPLKLPYNVSGKSFASCRTGFPLMYLGAENPYNAAQKFLQSNDLPLTYIDEVVKFIEKNTAGVNIGTGGDEYVDPFTGNMRFRAYVVVTSKFRCYLGASRYRAAPAPAPSAASQYVDPFTGGSRYVASSQAASTPSASYGGDPFTGASRYSGTPTPQPAPPPALSPSKVLPVVGANIEICC